MSAAFWQAFAGGEFVIPAGEQLTVQVLRPAKRDPKGRAIALCEFTIAAPDVTASVHGLTIDMFATGSLRRTPPGQRERVQQRTLDIAAWVASHGEAHHEALADGIRQRYAEAALYTQAEAALYTQAEIDGRVDPFPVWF